MSIKLQWARVSGWALRSNTAHTRCSFRSDFDIKQEPVIKPGKHPGCHETESARSPPLLNLLHIYPNLEQEILPLRLADARTWPHVELVVPPHMIQGVAVRRSNICLWAASATLSWCRPRPEAWIWHSILLEHACARLGILVNKPDSRQAAIIISRPWDSLETEAASPSEEWLLNSGGL